MNAIGVFDSGLGGLTVVEALRRRLPGESILYLGDTARLPYGTKSRATVTRYTQRNVAFLARRGVKAVVVACNTASALALPLLDAELPVWGVIAAGAARAAEVSRGRVGVIGTDSTIRSGAYVDALAILRPELVVASRACPLFVPLVEEGWLDDPVSEAVAARYLDPLLEAEIDTLLLGCTHYPLLATLLQRVVGEGVTLVDAASAVADAVAGELAALSLLRNATEEEPVAHHFCVTDAGEGFQQLASRFLGGEEISLEWVDVT